ELDLHGRRIAVLRVLDHEHHQESDDRGTCVDDELPSIAESEQRPRDRPHHDRRERNEKRDRLPRELRDRLGKTHEPKTTISHYLFLIPSRCAAIITLYWLFPPHCLRQSRAGRRPSPCAQAEAQWYPRCLRRKGAGSLCVGHAGKACWGYPRASFCRLGICRRRE